MNKIKVLYDVFKTMKGKDSFKGEFKLEAEKDKASVLNLAKEFQLDLSKGDGKFKISAEADCCGNKVKHEGSTEFNMKDCCQGSELMKKIHKHHHGAKCCGIKGHLNRIGVYLSVLNKINLEEKENNIIINLNLKELCKEICPEFIKGAGCSIGMDECCTCDCCACDCCKEFINCDYDEAILKVYINKNNEIEKVEVEANASDRSVKALLNLNW